MRNPARIVREEIANAAFANAKQRWESVKRENAALQRDELIAAGRAYEALLNHSGGRLLCEWLEGQIEVIPALTGALNGKEPYKVARVLAFIEVLENIYATIQAGKFAQKAKEKETADELE